MCPLPGDRDMKEEYEEDPDDRIYIRRRSQDRPSSRRGGRSRSRGINPPAKTPNNPCRNYEEIGFCFRGVHCDYYHDRNKPLDSTSLRQVFDLTICFPFFFYQWH